MKSILYTIIFATAITLVYLYVPGVAPFTARITDRTSPEVSEIVFDKSTLTVQLSDNKSGLKDVVIVLFQGDKTHEIYKESFPKGTLNRTISLPLSLPNTLRASGMAEGSATISVTVNDNALFSSPVGATHEILIDYMNPRLELLSLQHIVHQGGAELVVYKASDANLTGTGITVGQDNFPGFPLSYLDSEIKGGDLYASLFALPFDFDPANAKVTLYAEDRAGNRSTQPISFRLGNFDQKSVQPNLSSNFLQQKIPDLYNKYLIASAQNPTLDINNPEDLPNAFKFVNEEYRALLDAELKSILEGEITPRNWKGTFAKPMKSAITSNLGEKRDYMFNGEKISFSVHNGLDLASVRNDVVVAAQNGTVVLAKDFGIYGSTVVIDHGLGLFSLYGHLSSTLVNVGDTVSIEDPIGRSGETGLAGGDHLHFEFRVRSTPVNPIEWWDTNWISDNIDIKIGDFINPSLPVSPS